MPQATTVHISPYVAASILEHANRRLVAAGYLLGTNTVEEIRVMDFIPMTHTGAFRDVTLKAYVKERIKRVAAKRAFTGYSPIGWYSAGICPTEVTPEQFQLWCEMPSHAFGGERPRIAIHVHCALPDKGQNPLEVKWSAYLTRNELKRGQEKASHQVVTSTVVRELKVCVSALDHIASNVVLAHVASQVLYNGGRPYETSRLLNMDEVAFRTAAKGKSVSDALMDVQNKMRAALDRAREVVASASAAERAKEESKEMLDCVEQIRQLRESEEDVVQNPAARNDFNTQRFKDALMIKCLAVLLRKEITQIEVLAAQQVEQTAQQPQQQQQQQQRHVNFTQ